MGHLQMLFQYFFSPFLFRGGQNGHNDSRAGAEKSPPFARKTQKEGRKANLNVLQYIHKSKQWHSLTLYSDIYTVMEFLSIFIHSLVSQGVHVNRIFYSRKQKQINFGILRIWTNLYMYVLSNFYHKNQHFQLTQKFF